MRKLVALIFTLGLVLLAEPASARTEQFRLQWTQPCSTVDGDDLDLNNDNVCELLTGFRVYTEAGEFISGLPEDGKRTYDFSFNAPWGEQCFKMTAVMDDPSDPGQVLESDFSNVGGCKLVRPSKPQSPNITINLKVQVNNLNVQ